jgi:hypothetical protein
MAVETRAMHAREAQILGINSVISNTLPSENASTFADSRENANGA